MAKNKKHLNFKDSTKVDLTTSKLNYEFVDKNTGLSFVNNDNDGRFNLALKAKLVKNNDCNFTYVDGYGKEYNFDVKHYYIKRGERVYLEHSQISIDQDNSLYFELGGHKYPVITEGFCENLELQAKPDNFKDIEKVETDVEDLANVKNQIKAIKKRQADLKQNQTMAIEQRNLEIFQKELNEKEKNLYDASKMTEDEKILHSYVVDNNNGVNNFLQREIDDEKEYVFLDEHKIFQLRETICAYVTRAEELEKDKEKIPGSAPSRESTIKEIDKDIKAYNDHSDHIYDEILNQEQCFGISAIQIKQKQNQKYSNELNQLSYNKQLKTQEIQDQLQKLKENLLAKQETLQIDSFAYNQNAIVVELTELEIQLIQAEYQEKVLTEKIPVHIIFDSNDKANVLGFNDFSAGGELVYFGSKDGYTLIEYEDSNIKSIENSSGETINFTYTSNQRLIKLVTSLGKKTKFKYDASGNLIKINDAKFTYTTNNQLDTIKEDKNSITKIEYLAGSSRVSKISEYSCIDYVKDNDIKYFDVLDSNKFKLINSAKIDYQANNYVDITDKNNSKVSCQISEFANLQTIVKQDSSMPNGTNNYLASYNYKDDNNTFALSFSNSQDYLYAPNNGDKYISSDGLCSEKLFKSNNSIQMPLSLGYEKLSYQQYTDSQQNIGGINYFDSYTLVSDIYTSEIKTSDPNKSISDFYCSEDAAVTSYRAKVARGTQPNLYKEIIYNPNLPSRLAFRADITNANLSIANNGDFYLRAAVMYQNIEKGEYQEEFITQLDKTLANQIAYVPIAIDTTRKPLRIELSVEFNDTIKSYLTVTNLRLVEPKSLNYSRLNKKGQTEYFADDSVISAYVYDENDNVSKILEKDLKGKEKTSLYTYDKDGKLHHAENGNGIITELSYDKDSNLVQKQEYSKFDTSSKVVTNYDTKDANNDNDSEENSNDVEIGNESNSTEGFLTSLYCGGVKITYEYNSLGERTKVKYGDIDYLNYNVSSSAIFENGKKHNTTYANGDFIDVIVDKNGLEKQVNYNGNQVKTSTHDALDQVTQVLDSRSNEKIDYAYDTSGNVVLKTVNVKDSNQIKYTLDYKYSKAKELEEIKMKFDSSADIYNCYSLHDKKEDAYNRLQYTRIKHNDLLFTNDYSYNVKNNQVSSAVKQIRYGVDKNVKDSISYDYDENGNITRVYENGILKVRYFYDVRNQLVREDNKPLNFTNVFNYDNAGNITHIQKYSFSLDTHELLALVEPLEQVNYVYPTEQDKNRLSAIETIDSNGDVNTQTFSYDAMGNPTKYKDKTFVWQMGRQLAEFNANGLDVKYTYDTNGLRVKKLSNGSQTSYFYSGSDIIAEEDSSQKLVYKYSDFGIIGFSLIKDSTTQDYYYRKNLQGDITAILDNKGNIVVKYVYSGWGNHKVYAIDDAGKSHDITDTTKQTTLSVKTSQTYMGDELVSGDINTTSYFTDKLIQNISHIGNINPIRYRGYYYDKETNLYYLKSRYYDATVGRFINADDVSYLDSKIINGLNLYTYCINNPIMRSDSLGNYSWKEFCGFFTETIPNTFTGAQKEITNFFTETLPNAFTGAWKNTTDFFVNTVWNGGLVPAWNATVNFFSNTVPNFFVNTVWYGGLVPAWNATANFFSNTVPNFFTNTVWDKGLRVFFVDWIYKGGLKPAWNWTKNTAIRFGNWMSNNWKTVVDLVAGVGGVGISVAGLLSAFGLFAIPVVGQIIMGVVAIALGVWGIGRLVNWW